MKDKAWSLLFVKRLNQKKWKRKWRQEMAHPRASSGGLNLLRVMAKPTHEEVDYVDTIAAVVQAEIGL